MNELKMTSSPTFKRTHARRFQSTSSLASLPDPPQDAHLLPFSSGSSPARTAARAVAPAPSTTAFSCSTSRRMEMAIHSSRTVTTWWGGVC